MMGQLTVRFWGVRGSIAGGGPDCVRVGGNTSCVEVSLGNTTLILDGGTGLFRLGQRWGARQAHATLLFSHFHWDHIQGFPFFRPAYKSGNSFTLYGPYENGFDIEAALRRQMQPPNFPATLAAMRARLDFRSIRPGDEITVGPARVRAAALNHPQACLGYRITAGPTSLVYATDTEPLAGGRLDPTVVELARNADLLIHDAQYSDDEYYGRCGPTRRGWGHSTVTAACEFARAVAVKQLVLFHHDATHDDRLIQLLEEQARDIFFNVVAAREGMAIHLTPSNVQPATNAPPHVQRQSWAQRARRRANGPPRARRVLPVAQRGRRRSSVAARSSN